MKNEQNLSFDQVMILAENEPDKFIRCTNDEGTLNFLLKAIDIKNTVGNFDWKGVNFTLLGPTYEFNELNYKLCYIDDHCAWFTSNFEHQWGDDWDDKPYECNAGEPYDDYIDDEGKEHKINLIKVYFELPEYYNYLPCDKHFNSPYTVEMINKGAVAWIATDDFIIQAGTTYFDFFTTILKHKGKIFTETSALNLK